MDTFSSILISFVGALFLYLLYLLWLWSKNESTLETTLYTKINVFQERTHLIAKVLNQICTSVLKETSSIGSAAKNHSRDDNLNCITSFNDLTLARMHGCFAGMNVLLKFTVSVTDVFTFIDSLHKLLQFWNVVSFIFWFCLYEAFLQHNWLSLFSIKTLSPLCQ